MRWTRTGFAIVMALLLAADSPRTEPLQTEPLWVTGTFSILGYDNDQHRNR